MDSKAKLKAELKKEEEEEKKNNKSLKDTLWELADTSSLHGISKITSSRQLAVKVLWCLLFLGTLVVCLMQITSLFKYVSVDYI